jgi:Lon protease-like protein
MNTDKGKQDSVMTPEYLDIPIFPLPNVTFFPKTYLPLHIFEARYREMTAGCLEGDRLMGVALLREGWQNDYFGKPSICKTFGVGKIIDHEQTSDGRYNIVLEGLFRVRLIEEFQTSNYRFGRVRVLQDPPIDTLHDEISALMKELHLLTNRIKAMTPQLRIVLQNALSSHPHPLVIANLLASTLVVDAYDRQSILEQDDPLRRLNLVLVQLRGLLFQLDTRHIHTESHEEEE